jgi:hypothetical protein
VTRSAVGLPSIDPRRMELVKDITEQGLALLLQRQRTGRQPDR